MDLVAAINEFLDVWTDPCTAATVTTVLDEREVRAISALIKAMGYPDSADQWMLYHNHREDV